MPSANQKMPTATESDADPRELVQEEIEIRCRCHRPHKAAIAGAGPVPLLLSVEA